MEKFCEEVRMQRVGASRFSPAKQHLQQQRQIFKHSSHGSDGGDAVVLKKSKKEKVRKLSVVVGTVNSFSNSNSEMGRRRPPFIGSSNGEEEEDQQLLRSSSIISKRLKLPKKFSNERNTVDLASSVPRKLRSAIKKRSRESISPPLPDSRKLVHRKKEHDRMAGVRKLKLNVQQEDRKRSSGQTVVGLITKDEEEVVETLYALAGMFPDHAKPKRTKLNGELPEAKSLTSPEAESSLLASEVPKEEEHSKTTTPTATDESAVQPSDLEDSAGEAVKSQSLNEALHPDLRDITQFPIQLGNCVPIVKRPTMSLFSKSEPASGRPSCQRLVSIVGSELELGTGPNEPKSDGISPNRRMPWIAPGQDEDFRSQQELQPPIKESKNNGSALCPGLSSAVSVGAEMQKHSLQLSAAKLPAWLANATCDTRPSSSKNVALTDTDSGGMVDRRKSWRKCSAHVYISRLIKVLQITEKRDGSRTLAMQLQTDEGSRQGALLASNIVISGLNSGVAATSKTCSPKKSPNDVRNTSLLHFRLPQDQQQTSTTGLYASENEGMDFLYLSAGGCGVEANGGGGRARNGLEQSSTQSHSIRRSHIIMPLSRPQNHYPAASFPDHLSAAVARQRQQTPYLGSPFSDSSRSHLHPSYNQQEQEQHQQQWIWTPQHASQYRPGEVAATYNLPKWPYGGQNTPSLVYAQSSLPPCSSLEALGPMYASAAAAASFHYL